jgi:hypothetical protein
MRIIATWLRLESRRRWRSLLVLALLLVGPLALMAVNLLAAWPGQRAARLRTGHVLRAE